MRNDSFRSKKNETGSVKKKKLYHKHKKYERLSHNKNQKEHKHRYLNRVDKKLNAYHLTKIFKKYKILNVKKIIIDASGKKSNITLHIPRNCLENIFEVSDEYSLHEMKKNWMAQLEYRNFELNDKNHFIISIAEADQIIHQERMRKNSKARIRKRLKKECPYECLNVFEKKIISLSSKKFNKLVALKKTNEAKENYKNRKGKTRHKHRIGCCRSILDLQLY